MSNEQEHIEEHSSPIKTPKQLIVTVVLAFVVPIAIIILLVNMVTSGAKVGAGSDTLSTEAVTKRIAPVAGFALVDANAPKVFKTGEQVFAAVCTACHTAGVAGAPKVGDNGAWAPFIKAGYDAMLNVALHGKGGMPAKGGNPALSDYEVARAVVYMANKSGGSLPEPAEPAAEGDKKEAAAAPAAAAPAAAAPAAAAAAPAPAAPAAPAPAAAAPAPQAAAAVNPAGEKLYKSVCFACHATGVANAPKFGDKAAWDPYIKTGMDAMVKVAMQGKPPMPPKGGAADASEDDIRAAVQYMVDAAK
ncbi:cytochrome c5 family protein [Achromobacter denitrificans]|uniref:C-type cytochrome n=3 Tax=Achromobacter denitrificans TaxID=32002 RepID=A0A6N0JTM7_ACHDE|nr:MULTISPECIES: c-type cytochrome [Achromobacter]MDF3858402.1 c-type cytochrome [Achromobacter denitrificans]MDF3939780.1 c-type cytochrome [Achromobacter denitrificans]MDX3879742.1 c-type cytochrome [Achromobacter sp.]QKQ49980.1 cytochrome c5 family protein [Achromobacter denitrificans]WFC67892.1 cytochrome c5 family protein [Achromobacter denitrificans]